MPMTKEETKAYHARYYAAHREEAKAYGVRYHAAHREERKAYHASYRAANGNKIRAGKAAYRATPEGKARAMWLDARRRSAKRGTPFTITYEDVLALVQEYGRVCPALGTPFQAGIGRPIPTSMTLDCFEPTLGYVKGNVWVLSHKANSIKNSATRTELGRVYRWMCKVIGEAA